MSLAEGADPKRPLMDPATYAALRTVADHVDPRFAAALVLAHETGH